MLRLIGIAAFATLLAGSAHAAGFDDARALWLAECELEPAQCNDAWWTDRLLREQYRDRIALTISRDDSAP